jgi:hypothetical protein
LFALIKIEFFIIKNLWLKNKIVVWLAIEKGQTIEQASDQDEPGVLI